MIRMTKEGKRTGMERKGAMFVENQTLKNPQHQTRRTRRTRRGTTRGARKKRRKKMRKKSGRRNL